MRKWKLYGLGLLVGFGFAPCLYAQLPAVPGAPAGPQVPPVAPAAPNLWNFLLPPSERAAKCHDALANCEFLKNAGKPLNALTGGLLGNCGVPTAADLAKLKAAGLEDGAQGAAAKIKKSEAEAKARREAVRYLGTVDCTYWPEARLALKNSLRIDPSECVRYEAALSLARGCCCNKEIMKHLKSSANGDNEDGFPKESSPRVREAAYEALMVCSEVHTEPGSGTEKPNGKPGVEGPIEGKQTSSHRPASPRGHTKLEGRGKGVLGIIAASAKPTSVPQKSVNTPVANTAVANAPANAPAAVQPVAVEQAVNAPASVTPASVQPVATLPQEAAIVQTGADGSGMAPVQPVMARPQPRRGLLQIFGASMQKAQPRHYHATTVVPDSQVVQPASVAPEVQPAASLQIETPPAAAVPQNGPALR